ncbi:MAG: DUF1015 domain-containing protein, partial [Cryomorphaceae bacterium]
MINIVPFKAVRPPRDKAHLVASRSYVSYTPGALNRKLSENPYSFIHIINPEFSKGEKPKKNSPERFEKVRDQYLTFIKERCLLPDNEKAFYLYEQSSPRASFIGFIGGVSTADYRNGRIKKHEQTLTKREKMFCEYLDVCGFNAEPVLLTYPEHISAIDAFKATKRLERPEYEFTTTDRITHRMWIISDDDDIERIKAAFKKVDALYIADGHHRMASSALLAEKKANENPSHTGLEDYNYTMALVMPGETLRISPFHRMIGKGMDIEEDRLLESLSFKFDIKKLKSEFLPQEKRQFGLRLKSGWYMLILKNFEGNESALSHLDSVILTEIILEPILKITDQKTDKRIQFIPGNLSLAPYEASIDRGNAKALFTVC